MWLVARGCLGMAYPPGDPTKTPRGPREQLLEALPLDVDENPQNLAHGDLHDENVMFGNLDSLEHGYFPVLKMIDFGMAIIEFGGAKDNIFAIGEMMCELIYGERDIRELIDDKKGVNTIDPNLDSELLTLASYSPEKEKEPSVKSLQDSHIPTTQQSITLAALVKVTWAVVSSRVHGCYNIMFDHLLDDRDAPLPNIDVILGPCLIVQPVCVLIPASTCIPDDRK
ncbi:hypothetical protein NUW58_g3202 [Xylaria curta]|uniref:Uncharacterized protein n=1 Tax=Xylaria curta TaxID=42375 RepID=A0ACC1PC37_9PEZI|nr:hypothetical protein NUW58_g3202 [Xylaria curta]